jgi:hypothetical protein
VLIDRRSGADIVGAGAGSIRRRNGPSAIHAATRLGIRQRGSARTVAPYLEGYWFSRQELEGRHVLAMDGGAIYFINARLAVDGGVQVGLSEAAPSLSAFGGVSLVVGNVFGEHGHGRRRAPARR